MAAEETTVANSGTTTFPPEQLQDCPVDPDGDLEDPNNLFTCKTDETCCTVNLNPACCAKKDINDEM